MINACLFSSNRVICALDLTINSSNCVVCLSRNSEICICSDIGGFIFGKWLGTAILIFGNTLGGFLLYRLTKTFFSDLVENKLKEKFSKFINFFNRNEMFYFMCFRFIGGGGTPFPIQNILPVLFNMSSKNYIIATFLGILPTTFVTVALGSGIEKVINQNAEINFIPVIKSPEIYIPIIGFFIILIIAFFIKKIYFKNEVRN